MLNVFIFISGDGDTLVMLSLIQQIYIDFVKIHKIYTKKFCPCMYYLL